MYAGYFLFLAPVQMNVLAALRHKGRFLACLLFPCLSLSACSATPFYGAPESGKSLQRIVSERKPPLLVRVWSQTPFDYRRETTGVPSPIDSWTRNKTTAEWVREFIVQSGGHPSPIAPIMFVPALIVTVAGVIDYYATHASVEHDNIAMKECLQQLDQNRQDVSELVHTIFLSEPTTSVLERELHNSFAKMGLPQPDTQVEVTEKEWRRTDFVDAQKESRSKALLVADVRQKLEWGMSLPDRRCGLTLSFELDLSAIEVMETTERPLATEWMISISNFLESKDFQEFAGNPQRLRAWVSASVQALAERIAALYGSK